MIWFTFFVVFYSIEVDLFLPFNAAFPTFTPHGWDWNSTEISGCHCTGAVVCCSGQHSSAAVVSTAAAAVAVTSVAGGRCFSFAVVGTTVFQLLALSPHVKKVLG